MRILEIRVCAFGGLRDLSMELSEGLNPLHRPNGWGKSTLAAFLAAMLYGLPAARGENSDRKKYAPWGGGAFGGSVSFETEKGRFRAERFFGARESADTFALYDLSTNLESRAYSSRLGEELFGIDAEGFARTVCLSHAAPRTGGCASLSARLASLVEAAEDAGDFETADAALEKRIRSLRTTGSRGRIPELEARLVSLEREREALLGEERTLREKREEAEAAERESEALRREAESLRRTLRTAGERNARAARFSQRQELAERVASLSERKSALERQAGGIHPTDGELGEARRLLEGHLRLLAVGEEEPPETGGGFPYFGTAIAFLVLAALLLLGGAFLPPLLLAAVPTVLPAAVLLLLGRRERTRQARERAAYGERRSARDREIRESRRAAEVAVGRVGGTLSGGTAQLERISRREVEFRLLVGDLSTAQAALARFDAAYPEVKEQPAPSAVQTEALGRRLEELDRSLEELRRRASAATLAAERLSLHTEALPEVQAAILGTEEALEEARTSHEALTLAREHLRTARASLSTGYLHRLQARLRKYLAELDGDAPAPFHDASLSLLVETDTGTHPLSRWSSGWQDLIELCARLALCDVLFEGREVPPLVLDDPLITLDEAHLHAGKLLLSRLSERYQILYAYCHAERG